MKVATARVRMEHHPATLKRVILRTCIKTWTQTITTLSFSTMLLTTEEEIK